MPCLLKYVAAFLLGCVYLFPFTGKLPPIKQKAHIYKVDKTERKIGFIRFDQLGSQEEEKNLEGLEYLAF